MERMNDMEALLRSALVPVEPPGSLGSRLEHGLSEIADAAAGELAEWERSAMRDPRRWGRMAAALVVGGAAATGLVIVRARRQPSRRGADALRALQRGARDLRSDVGRRLGR